MAPPSKLAISTSVVLRLVKEEASYHREMQQQEASIKKLELNKDDKGDETASPEEITKAEAAVADAKKALVDIS
jgi:tubulin-specific chaperone A